MKNISIKSINEKIINGGFEDNGSGGLTGWFYSGTIHFSTPHSGLYAVNVPNGSTLGQALEGLISKDIMSVFGFWCKGSTPNMVVTFLYEGDESPTEVLTINSAMESWTWINLLSLMDNTKKLYQFEVDGKSGNNASIDDFSLIAHDANIDPFLDCDAIEWSEEQIWEVAIRDIPKRASGQKLDTATKTISPKTLDVTIRLSNSEKTTLNAIYDKHMVLVVATKADGSYWRYAGWFTRKPLVYEYKRQEDAIREWRANCEFTCDYYTFIQV